MSFVSNSREIGSCVSGTPSFVGQSDSYVSDLRQGEVPSSVRRSSISITEKSNRGNSSDSVDTRVLFSSLLGSQENWGNETCDRSLYSEQLPFGSPFQNGDQQIYQSLYSSRYVDHQTGPFGCLFPYPNFFGFQEISPICLEQQGLPISGGPVWPGGCTTGFYLGFSDGYSSPAYSVDSSSFLSGRFSSEGIRFRNSFSSYLPVYQTSSGPRLPYFLEKVSNTSFPRLPVFGGHYRTDLGLIFPPEEKFQSLCQKILIFSNSPSVTARQFAQLLGFLNSLADVVPLGRLHIRPLQFFLQEHWDSASQVWEALVPILPVLLPHLDWWTRRENVLTGVALLHPVPSLTLYTDSSLQGWGAFLEGKSVSGVWSHVQQQEHINLLEMRAVLLALQHFKTLLVLKSVVLATDNTTVVAYLQNQGGTRCHALFLLCKEILLLCLLSHIHLVVGHIPGTFNVLADCLSRFHNPVNTEWELRQVVFDSVVLRWDRSHVDLFATSLNHKLETFVSPVPDPLSFAVDAMSLSWDGMFTYAFPPFRFLLQVLLKIKQSDCKIILIAPAWPRQAWFPELLLLSCARPLKLPFRRDLLSQFKGKVVHSRPESLHLHAWLLSGRESVRKAFLKEQPRTSQSLSDSLQGSCMKPSGQSSVIGVVDGILIQSESLFNS